jgi:hypothetical protein
MEEGEVSLIKVQAKPSSTAKTRFKTTKRT